MGCSSCGTEGNGKPGGCKSNGSCSSGGCNRMNTFDWLSKLDIHEPNQYDVVEVSFKQGSRKGFYRNQQHTRAITGDLVVVETDVGYDIGHISLSGDLVRLQMKKKKVVDEAIMKNIIRRANNRDIDRLEEARAQEKQTMIRARAIARTLDLDMKVGDVEFQADKRKATFFYTAEGRVDFRELIRHFAKEFKVKIEMRQIGARQESARIGGIGSCGRELCCSTWLTDFKTVNTTAARYQNLAINQAKLSGQCGRLKCCLNYELDTYIDALKEFPKHADKLETEAGIASLVKTDIFKGIMYYAYQNGNNRGKFYPIELKRVKEILALNKEGKKALELVDKSLLAQEEDVMDYDAVNDVIELPPEERRRRKKRNNYKGKKKSGASRNGKDKPRSGGGDRKSKSGPNSKSKSKPGNKPNNKSGSKPKHKPKSGENKGKADGSNAPKAKTDGKGPDAKKGNDKGKRKFFNKKKKKFTKPDKKD